jgi:hypothetical protein
MAGELNRGLSRGARSGPRPEPAMAAMINQYRGFRWPTVPVGRFGLPVVL